MRKPWEDWQVIAGNNVARFSGPGTTECPYLQPLVNHIGFNGNGVRRGLGYKLTTWAKKAGYEEDELARFTDDLGFLTDRLGFIAAAIGPRGDWHRLCISRSQKLDDYHIRVYATGDCFDRWDTLFRLDPDIDAAVATRNPADVDGLLEQLRTWMHASGLQQQQHAAKRQSAAEKQLRAATADLEAYRRSQRPIQVTLPQPPVVQPVIPMPVSVLNADEPCLIPAGARINGDVGRINGHNRIGQSLVGQT